MMLRRLVLPAVFVLAACAPATPVLDLSQRLEAGQVRAGAIEKAADLIGGPTAVGAAGDFKLYNSKVAVIVEAPGVSEGYGIYGGQVIDADVIRPVGQPGRSVFGEALQIWEQRTFRATSAEVVNDGRDGKAAIVRMTGIDDTFALIEAVLGESNGPLGTTIAIDYVLAPDADVLQIITRPTAGPDGLNVNAHLVGFVMGDGQRMFLPGYGFDIPTVPGLAAPYFAGVSDDVSYTFVSDGAFVPVAKVEGFQLASLPGFGAGANEQTELNTFLVIGDGDLSKHEPKHREIMRSLGANPAAMPVVSGTVKGPASAPVVGARVHAVGANGQYRLFARTDADGHFVMELEPGTYTLTPSLADADLGTPVEVTVTETPGAPVALTLGPLGGVAIRVVEGPTPVPAKLQVIRKDSPAAPPASFGLPDRHHGRYRTEFLEPTRTRIDLPPGEYTLILTRGFEYDAVERTVTVTANTWNEVDVTLTRTVATPGWISGDYHVHAQRSADSDDLETHKVLAAAAEGLEIPISTEHEHIGDFAPAIAQLGLGAWVNTVVGEEVSTTPLGHFNAFPLVRDPLQQNYGAIWWYGVKGDDLMKKMRANPGRPLVQVNHPRSGSFGAPFIKGYFSATGLDAATLTPREARDWSTDYDAMEVSNGGSPGYEDWFAFLDRGYKLIGTGNSDSHVARSDMVGYPRNYVLTGEDDPAKFSVDSFMTALRAGRLTVSGGWFVEAAVGSKLPGEVLGAGDVTDGQVAVDVRVQAPAWLGAASGEIVVNGVVAASFEVPAAVGAVAKRVELQRRVDVPAGIDAHIIVRVAGGRLDPVLPGSSAFGFTNPIYVDGNGDGAYTGFRARP